VNDAEGTTTTPLTAESDGAEEPIIVNDAEGTTTTPEPEGEIPFF
jgi:hypothetical protein